MTLTYLIFPCLDIPNQWNALCLELNIWTAGDSIENSIEMLEDAILMCLENCPQLEVYEPAEPMYWEMRAHEFTCKKALTLLPSGKWSLSKLPEDMSTRDRNFDMS